MFREALRAMLEEGLVCPGCGDENIPGRPSVITIEKGTDDRAGCRSCGRYGPLSTFQRRQQEHV